MAMDHLQQARQLAQQGQLQPARQHIMQAIDVDRDNVEAWLLLAEISDSEQERQHALDRVQLLQPGHPRAQQIQSGGASPRQPSSPASAPYQPPVEKAAASIHHTHQVPPSPPQPNPLPPQPLQNTPASSSSPWPPSSSLSPINNQDPRQSGADPISSGSWVNWRLVVSTALTVFGITFIGGFIAGLLFSSLEATEDNLFLLSLFNGVVLVAAAFIGGASAKSIPVSSHMEAVISVLIGVSINLLLGIMLNVGIAEASGQSLDWEIEMIILYFGQILLSIAAGGISAYLNCDIQSNDF